MTQIGDSTTITAILEKRVAEDVGRPFCLFKDRMFTVGELDVAANSLANGLGKLGVTAGDRVAVMLPNHPDYIITMLALIKMRAVWIPINAHLRGPSLRYIIEHSEPHAMITDIRYQDVVDPILDVNHPSILIWRGDNRPAGADVFNFAEICATSSTDPPRSVARAHDVLCISYTSGTTGEPKGVMITDKMLRACAAGAAMGADIHDDDVLLVWEPLYHIAGSEIIIVALLKRVTIALLERFSASQFWYQVHQFRATHIHYVGGVLQILLKRPPTEFDSDNPVRVAWGGGCTVEAWKAFEQRFGVQIREVYGLTEASSISTINIEGRVGSIGKCVPYFEIRLVDDQGISVPAGTLGEIVVGERESGLLMREYFRNPEATRHTLRDGWLFTGDLGHVDEEGFLYYSGRKKDSLRRKGENISAWEVERIINKHPDVELSALVGVASDVGDTDLKVFVKLIHGRHPDPVGLIKWCESQMPYFQVPRYVAYVTEFEMTPTQRIRKEALSRATNDCWDRQRPDIKRPSIEGSAND